SAPWLASRVEPCSDRLEHPACDLGGNDVHVPVAHCQPVDVRMRTETLTELARQEFAIRGLAVPDVDAPVSAIGALQPNLAHEARTLCEDGRNLEAGLRPPSLVDVLQPILED